MILNFFRDKHGATSIEYALVASLIGMVIIGAVSVIGGKVMAAFQAAADGFN